MSSIYDELDRNFGLATDLYELTMAQAYFDQGMDAPASFSLSVRSVPPDWGFFVFAGIDGVLSALEAFRYPPTAIDYLATTGLFSPAFLDSLARFRFTGEVHALAEGEVFFPDEPLLEITGPVVEAQLVETVVINRASFATLIASKAARSVLAAPGRQLVDFTARRTQSLEAGLAVARSSYLAGYAGTSNVLAAKVFGLTAYGTMAHSFVTCFDEEMDAFRAFARSFPDQSVLLVDTYDTLGGVEKAITVARELEAHGHRLRGVRLDSGDLVQLSRRTRVLLDEAGLRDATIVASGGLDEHKVAALIAAGAPIDVFGIGTDLGVAADAPALDIAYKLVEFAGKPRLKLSTGKETLAGRKQVYRRFDARGVLCEDMIAMRDEPAPGRDWSSPLLVRVMEQGERTGLLPSLADARAACQTRLARLAPELTPLRRPAAYPVRCSAALDACQREAARACAPRRQ
jgi:nicotinate phosphoribosyltransferase